MIDTKKRASSIQKIKCIYFRLVNKGDLVDRKLGRVQREGKVMGFSIQEFGRCLCSKMELRTISKFYARSYESARYSTQCLEFPR